MPDSDLIELREQQDELTRMKRLSELSEINKRWLKRSHRLASLFCDKQRHKIPDLSMDTYMLKRVLDADFVLSDQAQNEKDERLFTDQLTPKAREWLSQTLTDGKDVFVKPQSDLKIFEKPSGMLSPATVVKGFALALDDVLFKAIRPNILSLVALNSDQKWRRIWPKSLTNKIQYALEQRLAKSFAIMKKYLTTAEMANYIQNQWLTPIVEKAQYSPEDPDKIKTICRASEKTGVPLDKAFIWHMQSKAAQNRDVVMEMVLRDQSERHATLRKRQSYSILHWIHEYRLKHQKH